MSRHGRAVALPNAFGMVLPLAPALVVLCGFEMVAAETKWSSQRCLTMLRAQQNSEPTGQSGFVDAEGMKNILDDDMMALTCMKTHAADPMLQYMGIGAITQALVNGRRHASIMEMERTVSAVFDHHASNTALQSAAIELLDLLDAHLLDAPMKPPQSQQPRTTDEIRAPLSSDARPSFALVAISLLLLLLGGAGALFIFILASRSPQQSLPEGGAVRSKATRRPA